LTTHKAGQEEDEQRCSSNHEQVSPAKSWHDEYCYEYNEARSHGPEKLSTYITQNKTIKLILNLKDK